MHGGHTVLGNDGLVPWVYGSYFPPSTFYPKPYTTPHFATIDKQKINGSIILD